MDYHPPSQYAIIPQMKYTPLIIPTLLIVINYFGLSLYLPSYPALTHAFATSRAHIQLSLTCFLIGSASFQFLFGFMADAYGRKRTIMTGTVLFIIGTLIALYSHHIGTLLLARFIQGSGAAVFSAFWKIVLRDNYQGKALTKANSLLVIAWACLPIAAPVLGSYTQAHFGWHGNFYLMLIAAIAMLIICWRFYHQPNVKPSRQPFLSVVRCYYDVLTTPIFILSIGSFILLDIIDIGFSVEAPFLLQSDLHFSTIQYGWSMLFVASGALIGGLLQDRLVHRLSTKHTVISSVIAIILISALLCGLSLIGIFTWWSVLIPMFLLQALLTFPFVQLIATAMSAFDTNIGIASAAIGILFMLSGACSSSLMALLPKGSPIAFSSSVLIAALLAFALLQKWRKALAKGLP